MSVGTRSHPSMRNMASTTRSQRHFTTATVLSGKATHCVNSLYYYQYREVIRRIFTCFFFQNNLIGGNFSACVTPYLKYTHLLSNYRACANTEITAHSALFCVFPTRHTQCNTKQGTSINTDTLSSSLFVLVAFSYALCLCHVLGHFI